MTSNYILGGYTRRINDGISQIIFDSHQITFNKHQGIAQMGNPTYLAISPSKNLLFSILGEADQGGVAVFEKKEDGWLELDRILFAEKAGCHISYREASQTLYVSNYHLGRLDVIKFANNRLDLIQTIEYEGSSVHPEQKSSHIHYAGCNRQNPYLFVCDLGSDKVYNYYIDEQGYLKEKSHLTLPAGTGPRHLVLHPNEPYAYIIGELANTTTIVSVDAAGNLMMVDQVMNIAEHLTQEARGAAIRISHDGKYLYLSTRFHNTLTVFEISQNASQLTKIQEIDSHGEIPRDFTLNPQENYVLVAHQDSDNISVFSRDKSNGLLEFVSEYKNVPECVCILNID